ncbi:MAG: UDP-3-O-(3-hydroxymyristoyl) glucosamine N-acyltransferase, non-repeat region [Crocinitomicaceae bacterium]|jgi:UDP-3-O-[3-hydroxymyristoyl] glucosamine N-acyltransferase|nr:UDP-3-O-(3-hydroxymyristoyl) glucosamine N-acyltransferase, non-repeat region [Crocinitomicaceae bacterium]
MKLPKALKLSDAATFLNCEFVGNPDHLITGINEIHMVESGDLVFVDHPKYYDKALNSAATTILIDKKTDCPEGKGLLVSNAPFDDFNRLTRHYDPVMLQETDRGADTQIDETAFIYPGVFIGNRVTIEKNVIIYPNAVIMDNTIIREGAKIGPGAIIGHFAFYYKKKPAGFEQMHSCGGVIIGKNTDIGAGCTIDKGVSAYTIIGDGTKLDNQVHVGHDTVIGKNCLMAAQVGLAGCVTVEDNVTLWGQVGCASDVVIGEGAVVLAQSGISKSLEGGKTYFGSPCGEVKEKFKELAALRQLPAFMKK